MFEAAFLPSNSEREDGHPARDESLGHAQQQSSSFEESDLTMAMEQQPLYRRHGYSTEEEFRAAERRAKQRVHKIAPWIAGLGSVESVASHCLETDHIYTDRSVKPTEENVKPAHEYFSKKKGTASSCLGVAKDMGRSAQKAMETFKKSAFNVRIEPSSAKAQLPVLPPLFRAKSKLGKRGVVIGRPVLEGHVAWHRPGEKTAGHHMISIKEAQIRESNRRKTYELKQEQGQRDAQPTLHAGGARKPSVNRAPRIQSTWGALIDAAQNLPGEDDSASLVVAEGRDPAQESQESPRPQTAWPDGFERLTLDFSKSAHESQLDLDDSFTTTEDSWFETEPSSSASPTPPATHSYVFPDTPLLQALEGRFKHMSADEDDEELVIDQHVRQDHLSTYGKHAVGGKYVDAWRSRTHIGAVEKGDPAAVLMQQLDVARQTGVSLASSKGAKFF